MLVGMSCSYKLVVSAPEAKKLTTPTITNIQVWICGELHMQD